MCDVKRISEMTSSELFTEMTATQKRDIFDMVKYGFVYQDVEGLVVEMGYNEEDEETSALCEAVANRYVYDGDCDSNLSYWDNLRNLINEEKTEAPQYTCKEILKNLITNMERYEDRTKENLQEILIEAGASKELAREIVQC